MVSLRGRENVINLIIMGMPDFDAILGMDFLSKYGAEIDYKNKKV